MPKEINAKAGLVKASKDVLQHMVSVGQDINARVTSAQGQSALLDNARTAMDRMIRLVADLEGMAESEFTMITVEEKADAKGHQSR